MKETYQAPVLTVTETVDVCTTSHTTTTKAHIDLPDDNW